MDSRRVPTAFFLFSVIVASVHGAVLPARSDTVEMAVIRTSGDGVPKEACDACKKFTAQVETALTDPEAQRRALSVALFVLCKPLPGALGEKCESSVSEIVPMAFSTLASAFSEDTLCKKSGICTATTSRLSGHVAIKDGPACDICKSLYQQLVLVLESEKVQVKVQEALEKACSKLEPKNKGLAAKCEALVETYVPELIVLLQSVSPSEFCHLARYCSSSDVLTLHGSDMEDALSAVPSSTCISLTQKVQGILASHGNQAKLEVKLARACKRCPKHRKRCLTKAHRIPAALASSWRTMNATGACTQDFGMSQKVADQQVAVAVLRSSDANNEGLLEGGLCGICEKVFKQALQVLGNKETQQTVLADLLYGCSLLPAAKADKCAGLVTEYYTAAIELLESTSPEQFCRDAANLCASGEEAREPTRQLAALLGSKPELKLISSRTSNSQQCAECRFVVNEAKKKLKDPANQVKLTTFLTETCNKFPDYKDECLMLLEEYLPILFSNVDELLNPVNVCRKVGFCSSKGLI